MQPYGRPGATHIHDERLQCYAGASTNRAVHTLASTIMRGDPLTCLCDAARGEQTDIADGAKCDYYNYDVTSTKWMDEEHVPSTYTYLQ